MSKVIVISGIAQGMGREVSLMLASQGYTICGFDIEKKYLDSLADELNQLKAKFHLETLSVTDSDKILKFKDTVLKKFGSVDTVVSNVGIGFFGPFEEVNLVKALQCFDINVIGCARLLQAFIPSMRERKSGKIVVMSSLVGQVPFPFESIYSATKFAIEGMVSSFRYEVKPFGIQVAMIQPAQVSTNFAAKAQQLPDKNSPYYDRCVRFINRDNELIKKATNPKQAAEKIVKVIQSKNPNLFNQVDFMSSFFLGLNRFLPQKLKDKILLDHMNINV
ncbi:Short chain dehydrogenase [Leptospira biflexa serovar Patoc strain 'Patoc 1 (Ames)']|jgi:short-subunit dehydrogenase|uniref:Putative short chain dehydrogenase n=1 Tax=Leptospira biflexa serovar Patoc (strain Patoc 1 / ATCC 23582 / Paris) TaxID=456481 RepID=B0SJU0_LEPBP|nr:SDR family NAD(P)-dependent oxidoreductase [Leptospira biflexa]ABZ92652.1 Short chain dehydrogenase [Leptospira biflexa serovar Patoc strain 'Patoc 1 (Ames)']ABZ96253.1 Putative short chain dehydrogenase [Leptospira biflexa serovar Patoc strain 'Patoc 1 (Paris)']